MTLWPQRFSLRMKITLGLVITLSIILGVLTVLMRGQQRKLLIEANQHLSSDLSNVVADSLHHAMLEQSDGDIQMIMDSIARHYDVMSVSIVRADGSIYLSSDRDALSRRISVTASDCVDCTPAQSLSADRTFATTDAHGRTVLRGVSAIPNEPPCQICHDQGVEFLGYVVTDFATGDLESQMTALLRSYAIWNLAALAIVAVAVNLLLNQLVVSRLMGFVPALERISAGDVTPRLSENGHDEIAALAKGFNRMAAGLSEKAALEEAVHRESDRLSSLQRVIDRVSRTLELDVILYEGLAQVIDVTNMEAGEILLWDADQTRLYSHVRHGLPDRSDGEGREALAGVRFCDEVAKTASGVIVADPNSDSWETWKACVREGFAAAACIPLRSQERVVGVLILQSTEKRAFDPKETEWMQAIGNHLGIAIENAMLYREVESRVEELTGEVQSLAVLQERDRLAREMHDGFAQSLGYLHLQLAAVSTLIRDGRMEEAREAVAQTEQVVGETYDDVREVISNLRSTLLKAGGLVPTLAEYVPEFGLRYDLDTHIVADPDLDGLCLPEASELQLLRIVQEALSNVRKHARARRAWVTLAARNGHFHLEVEDDGIGFNMEDLVPRGEGHYGLSVMRERASGLGGHCSIQSRPGQGTAVRVDIPIPQGG